MPEISDDTARRGLRLFRKKAEAEAREPSRLRALATRARTKMKQHGDQIGEIREDLPVLVRAVRAYSSGEYRKLPWKTVTSIVAALLYFVSPADLIPDFIPVIGYIDDAAVIALVLRGVRGDLTKFERWESKSRGLLTP